MNRIPHRALKKANEFVLELNANLGLNVLRERIPVGLNALIPCDRASFNEAELGVDGQRVLPSPIPSWWSRFGAIYAAHVLEHPLFRNRAGMKMNRTIALNDYRDCSWWKSSVLKHEYFVPLGVRHQLSAGHLLSESTFVGTAVNRSGKDFRAEERALFDFVAPHICQAWQNAQTVASLERPRRPRQQELAVLVDTLRGTMRPLCSHSASILRRHFPADSDGTGPVPDEIKRWLLAQAISSRSLSDNPVTPAPPLIVRSASARFSARVLKMTAADTLLLLDEIPSATLRKSAVTGALTTRETQILHWIAEGKRNAEIAVIVGSGRRTVEKHVEQILAKLGVETRSAAVRSAFEFTPNLHA
ncbi:MAG: helix-turn-helix transcriptional regulator [Opitutus sp.]